MQRTIIEEIFYGLRSSIYFPIQYVILLPKVIIFMLSFFILTEKNVSVLSSVTFIQNEAVFIATLTLLFAVVNTVSSNPPSSSVIKEGEGKSSAPNSSSLDKENKSSFCTSNDKTTA